MSKMVQTLFVTLTLLVGLALAPREAVANDPQKLIDDANAMARSMLADPEWRTFQAYYKEARGVVLVPDYLRAGFVLGGAGGQCVLAARNAETGVWSPPAFCLMGEASIGFQIGAEKSEMIMLIMTDGALDKLISGNAKLGADAGIAIGLIGAGVGGKTTLNLGADIYVFARNQGLFGGVAIEGGWIGPDSDYNQAYYGQRVSARSIVFDGVVSHQGTEQLRRTLADAGM